MDVPDQLLDKIFLWVKLQKQCANTLNKLASELEKHKKNVNISRVVGSSVSVGGAVAMATAGIVSVCTGGLAIPFLGTAGVVATGLGLANNVGSEIVSAVISGCTMKEAGEIAEKIENLEKGIQKLMKTLQQEGQKREQQAGSSSDISEEDYVVEKILRVMAKRQGLELHSSISLCKMLTALSKNTISGKDTALSLLKGAALGLSLLSKFVVQVVAKKAGKTVMSKLVPELIVSVGPKAAAKAVGRIAGGVVGVAVSIPELVVDCINLDKCETEGSKRLRENAKDIQAASEEMEKELEEIKKTFQRLARIKRCIEKTERRCVEREILIEFAMEQSNDEVVQQWLKENGESHNFFKLLDMFQFLKEKIDEEEEKNHTNTVDITFVAHGAIEDSMIPARCLLPLPTISDVVLYSPWNCVITADAAYGVATGVIKPQHRVFCCKKKKGCKIRDAKHQPTKLLDEWNSMKKAGGRKVPNIMLSSLKVPRDGAWERIVFLEEQHGKPGRNRLVIPFIIPGKNEEIVPFFVVTLALSLVLLFSRFQATLHLTACLGKISRRMNLDEDAMKEQYAYTTDNTVMTSEMDMLPKGLFRLFKTVFD